MSQGILCFNAWSQGIPDREVQRQTASLQIYLTRYLCPAWSTPAPVLRFGTFGSLQKGEWALGWFKDADQAGILGYHELGPDGEPLGKIFVHTTRQYGGLVPVTAGHEGAEIVIDHDLNRFVTIRYKGKDCLFPVEICDPCEADELAFDVAGEPMSDFCLPSYFHQDPKGPYSYRKSLRKPIPSLARGGYLAFSTPDGKDHEIHARGYTGHRGSRHARRLTPRHLWRRSEPVGGDRLQSAGEP